jgi:hypothetical protein
MRSTKPNSDGMKILYENLASVLMTLQFPPDKAVDITEETRVSAVQKLGRIMALKRGKRFGVPVTWESGRNVAVCADGPLTKRKSKIENRTQQTGGYKTEVSTKRRYEKHHVSRPEGKRSCKGALADGSSEDGVGASY